MHQSEHAAFGSWTPHPYIPPGVAEFYKRRAEKLRGAYVAKFLSPTNGWFVSWISADGQAHDYCHTFVNGMAVAYGLVPPTQGKEILECVVRKSHEIGFTKWLLGVPTKTPIMAKR